MHGIKQAPPTVRLKTLPYPPNQTPPPGGRVRSRSRVVGKPLPGLAHSAGIHRDGFSMPI